MLQKIFLYIEENEMIAAGDLVLAGVSGGADSMCLLMALLAYRKRVPFVLRVVHVEHGIRGGESLADAAYVERFCTARGVSCEVVHVDAVGGAKERGLSLEEAARVLRYEAFERCAARAETDRTAQADGAADETADQTARVGRAADGAAGHVRIAVAHHREDQAETVLWQMIRGSDVRGLGGMRPKRGRIIRPLLAVCRDEIEDFLRAEGVCWREDATNALTDYTRNRIRHEVVPVLAQMNAQAACHLCETAERMQETEDFLREQTDRAYGIYVGCRADGALFLAEGLLREHSLLQRRVVYEALCMACTTSRDIGAHHVKLIVELFSRQVGRVLHLPGGCCAGRVYGGVTLSAGKTRGVFPTEGGEADIQAVPAGGCETDLQTFPAGGCGTDFQALPAQGYAKAARILPGQVRMEVLTQFDLTEISKKKYTKWFDYDKIKDNVQIRRRRGGDYLVIDGAGHRQKLSRYMVNAKIPREERDNLLLLADGAHVMWVIGYRISDEYEVDKNTTTVLKVQVSGGKEDE